MRGRRVIDEDDEDTDTLLKEIAEMDFELDDLVEKSKDIEKNEEETIVKKPKKWQILGKVIVSGNFESSFKKFQKTLTKANVVNDNMEWISEKTTLVLAGNFFGNGGDTQKIFDAIQSWQPKAKKLQSQILCIMGKNEFDIAIGKKHVSKRIVDWVKTLPLYRKIGRTIVSYGGLTPYFTKANINQLMTEFWSGKYGSMQAVISGKSIKDPITTNYLRQLFTHRTSPLRFFNYDSLKDVCVLVEATLNNLAADRMIVASRASSSKDIFKKCKKEREDTKKKGSGLYLLNNKHTPKTIELVYSQNIETKIQKLKIK